MNELHLQRACVREYTWAWFAALRCLYYWTQRRKFRRPDDYLYAYCWILWQARMGTVNEYGLYSFSPVVLEAKEFERWIFMRPSQVSEAWFSTWRFHITWCIKYKWNRGTSKDANLEAQRRPKVLFDDAASRSQLHWWTGHQHGVGR